MKKYYFTLFLSISITVGFSQVPETFEEYAFVEALLKEEVRLKRTMTNVEVNKLIGAYGDIHFKVENNTLIQTYEGREYAMINIGTDIFKVDDFPDYFASLFA